MKLLLSFKEYMASYELFCRKTMLLFAEQKVYGLKGLYMCASTLEVLEITILRSHTVQCWTPFQRTKSLQLDTKSIGVLNFGYL